MSKKTTSTTDIKFDPASMGRYQAWGGEMFPQLSGLFQNPFNNPFYALNLQMGQRAAGQLGQRASQNALANASMQGISGLGSGARAQLMGQLGRYGAGLGFQGFQNAFSQAQMDRWNAAQMGSHLFGQPLQTGQTTTQKTSGLGTWLPQVIGAGLSIAAAPFTGGASLMGMGGLGAGFGGGLFNLGGSMSATPSGYFNPFGAATQQRGSFAAGLPYLSGG